MDAKLHIPDEALPTRERVGGQSRAQSVEPGVELWDPDPAGGGIRVGSRRSSRQPPSRALAGGRREPVVQHAVARGSEVLAHDKVGGPHLQLPALVECFFDSRPRAAVHDVHGQAENRVHGPVVAEADRGDAAVGELVQGCAVLGESDDPVGPGGHTLLIGGIIELSALIKLVSRQKTNFVFVEKWETLATGHLVVELVGLE